MSKRPLLVVLSNDAPDSSYGAKRLAAAFEPGFESLLFDPTSGFGGAEAWFDSLAPDALVLSGSERSVRDAAPWIVEEQEIVREAAKRRVPLLGVCFGHQLVAAAFGAELVSREKRVGIFPVRVAVDDPLLGAAGDMLRVPEQHADHVVRPPAGFDVIARSSLCDVEAMRHVGAPVYGVQFHPCYENDVIAEDEAWRGFDRAQFVHDGASVLRGASEYFREMCE